MIGRRGFITGLVSFVAAPAIVRAGSLMPVRGEPLIIGMDFGIGPMRYALPAIRWRSLNGTLMEDQSFSQMFEPVSWSRL